MESLAYHDAAALLAWQLELGADECITDTPVNRYETPATAPKASAAKPNPAQANSAPEQRGAVPLAEIDTAAIARTAAAGAADLDALKTVISGFAHCELKKGARNLVFGDGDPAARVMVIGEAPDRDEDRAGKPFIGDAGDMLDAMFAAIGMGRTEGAAAPLYVTNALPWRPPQDRDPTAGELATMLPFLERQIELVNPDVLVIMGNIAAQALLGKRGITRLRGTWTQAAGRPAMPMLHASYLIRNRAFKRDAWADLLAVQARLRT